MLFCSGPRQTLLLCLLALSPGRAVDSGRILDALWPGVLPNRPSNTLQSQVSRLRRLVGGDAVLLTAGGYVLQTGRHDVDATTFEDQVLSARRMLTAGAYASALALVDAAEALWVGDPMVQLQDDPSVRRATTRLAELRLDATVVRVEAEIALGLLEPSVVRLRAVLEQHPLREDLWALLVTALYRAGRTAEALDAHRAARRVLVRELGLEPGPVLRDLERDILGRAPHLAAPVHPCTAHAPLLAGSCASAPQALLPPEGTGPAAPAGWRDYPAPRLFLDRLQLAHPQRARPCPDAGQAADIVQLCRLLRGDPLAIELAAVSLGQAGLDGLPVLLQRHRRAAAASAGPDELTPD